MIGAVIGDIIGSVYEWNNIKTKDFALFSPDCKFTDDTVLTVALAEAILNKRPYEDVMIEYANLYPDAGYGGFFRKWIANENRKPYNSYGNGAAMRISPCAWAFNDLETVLALAEEFTRITHNHPLGIKWAQAVSGCILLARKGKNKDGIREFLKSRGCLIDFTLDDIRPTYKFNATCQGSVPQAIQAFLESDSYVDAIRNAISIGGDSDTIACVTGSIAQPFYGDMGFNESGVPLRNLAYCCLDDKLIDVLEKFEQKFANENT